MKFRFLSVFLFLFSTAFFAGELTIQEVLSQEERAAKSEKLVKAIHELYDRILITARSSSLTGSSVDIENPQAVQEALPEKQIADIHEHAAFSNVNLIRRYGDRILNTKSEPVVNPIVFTQCVESLLSILEQAGQLAFSSDENRQAILQDIQTIIQIGQATIEIIERAVSPEIIHSHIKNCRESLQLLKRMFNSDMTQEMDDSFKEDMIKQIQNITQADLEILNSIKPLDFNDLFSTFGINGYLYSGCPNIVMHALNIPGRIKEYKDRLDSWKMHIGETTRERISAIEENRLPQTDIPLSQLVFPSSAAQKICFDNSNEKAVTRPFLCKGIRVAPEYVQAELHGLGRIVSEFDIDISNWRKLTATLNENVSCPFYIRVYFEYGKNERKFLREYKTEWKEITRTAVAHDEAVYYHIFGGSRLTTKMFSYCHGLSGPYGGKMMVWGDGSNMVQFLPQTVTPQIDFVSIKSISQEAAHLATIQQLTELRTQQKRLSANKLVTKKAETHSEYQSGLTSLGASYKMLEGSCVLAHSEQFQEHPACALFRNGNLLKNRAAIIAYLKRYQDEQSGLSAQQEYLPVEETVEAFESTASALVQHRPELPDLRRMILRLNVALHAAREILVERPISSMEFLSRRVDTLQDEQKTLKTEVANIRSDVKQLNTEVKSGFTQILELLRQRN